MAGNIDDACLDEYPHLDESFGFALAPGEWVGDYDHASELEVSDLVSSSALYYSIINITPLLSTPDISSLNTTISRRVVTTLLLQRRPKRRRGTAPSSAMTTGTGLEIIVYTLI